MDLFFVCFEGFVKECSSLKKHFKDGQKVGEVLEACSNFATAMAEEEEIYGESEAELEEEEDFPAVVMDCGSDTIKEALEPTLPKLEKEAGNQQEASAAANTRAKVAFPSGLNAVGAWPLARPATTESFWTQPRELERELLQRQIQRAPSCDSYSSALSGYEIEASGIRKSVGC
eukprot:s2229_g4.t1